MGMRDLTGRVALVTGAAGVVGRATTEALRREGARVVATDLRDTPEQDVRALDVTQPQSWARVVASVMEDCGRLDILVQSVGVAPVARLEDQSLDEWRRCQAINVEGVLLGIQAALPLLMRSANVPGGGSIVNIASAAANRAAAFSGAYCTSKAAVAMLSKAAAVEFATLGYPVRVNTVHPGAVQSAMIDGIVEGYSKLLGGRPVSDLAQSMRDDIPMGRLAHPEDVAEAVVWLASDASRFVTGAEIHVDGGFTAR